MRAGSTNLAAGEGVSDIVDIDPERGCDLLEGVDRPLTIAVFQLRHVRRGEAGLFGELFTGHAAIFTPHANLGLANDQPVGEWSSWTLPREPTFKMFMMTPSSGEDHTPITDPSPACVIAPL